jgi:hypothetical protein
LIDSGAELFGNFTSQPSTNRKGGANGFLALAVFDQPRNGGNGDGQISAEDSVYSDLRVWIDSNHDGISQPDELKTLAELGIRALSLRYTVNRKTDEFGNVFEFNGHVTMDRDAFAPGAPRRRATDVFLTYIH